MTDKRWQSALTDDFGLINMQPRWTFEVVEKPLSAYFEGADVSFSLWDEINRADAGTLAAMTKALDERQITLPCQKLTADDAAMRPLSKAQQDRFTVQLRY